MPVETPPIQIDGDPLQLRWRGPCPVRCGGRGLREALPGGGVKIYCDTCEHYAIFRADGSMIPPVAREDLPRPVSETADALGGAGGCRVDGCGSMATGATGLCALHRGRWDHAGQPDLHAWIDAGAPSKGGRASKHKRVLCATPGCTMPIFSASGDYGTDRKRYCGRCEPYDNDAPPTSSPAATPEPKETTMAPRNTQPKQCEVDGCGKKTQAKGLCSTHWSRWRNAGRPPIAEFVVQGGPRPGDFKPLGETAQQTPTEEPAPSPARGTNSTTCDDQFAPEPPSETPTRVAVTPADARHSVELVVGLPDASGRLALPRPINRIGVTTFSRPVDAIRVSLMGHWLTITDETGRMLRQFELAHDEPTDEEATQ